MSRVVQHAAKLNPFTKKPVGNVTAEYFLPVDRNQLPAGEEIPAAFSGIADSAAELANRSWASRFSDCQTEGMASLAQQLNKFAIRSLILFKGRWFLRGSLSNDDYSPLKNCFYRVPLESSDTDRLLSSFENPCLSLREFVRFFAGLRLSMPGESGHFAYDDFEAFADTIGFEHRNQIKEWDEQWSDAACFYYASNGDMLLLDRNGRAGWFAHDTGVISKYADSFDQLLMKFIEAHRIDSAFDAYHAT